MSSRLPIRSGHQGAVARAVWTRGRKRLLMRKERPMSNDHAGWENALTVLQEVQPPFFPAGAEVKTVLADFHPEVPVFRHTSSRVRVSITCWRASCSLNSPHKQSGPSFYYMLEGELQFELEGEPSRVIRGVSS